MTSPGPVTRRAAAARPPDAHRPPHTPGPPGPPPERPRPDHRRVTLLALLLSAVLHVLLILLYPLLVDRPGVPSAGEQVPADRFPGMEVVRLREVAELPVEPEEPVTRPDATPVPPRPPAARPADPAQERAPAVQPAPTGPLPPVAERLRPGEADARLWHVEPDLAELTDRQLARLLLVWTIEEMGDSALAAEAAARAAMDWTYTDGEGKKWGISPGKLHLGDITLPLPFSFSAPPDQGAAWRAWADREIARGAIDAAARENLKDRIEAIRERRDRQRREGGTRPDTTRLRR